MAQEVQLNKYPLQTLLLKKEVFIAQLLTITFTSYYLPGPIKPVTTLAKSVHPPPPELQPRPDQPRRRALEPARRLLPATNQR